MSSTSANVIFFEEDLHPIILYNSSDGAVASYSAQYDRVTGAGMILYEMLQGYQKEKKIPDAERAANEYLMLMNGSCRIADRIHPDVEYIYVMHFHNDLCFILKNVLFVAWLFLFHFLFGAHNSAFQNIDRGFWP